MTPEEAKATRRAVIKGRQIEIDRIQKSTEHQLEQIRESCTHRWVLLTETLYWCCGCECGGKADSSGKVYRIVTETRGVEHADESV